MKNKTLKYSPFIVFLILLVACSTKKNTFLSRNSHALSTEYNIDFNGQVALDKGIVEINTKTADNFWKFLPIERMQIEEESTKKTKNANFELAETKATKAIQRHSMNINGNEKNTQMDESYLLLGKARYYDQRFLPALDAFNYILYKYPNSDKIYEAKIWREKTNMRLGNDGQVIKNISKLLSEKKLKKQTVSDANALLAQSFLNLEEKDSAISKLKVATKFSRKNAQKARYRFILGQLFQELGEKDSARFYFQSIIDMNRRAERLFTMQSYAKIARLFDFEKGDTLQFTETFHKLLLNRENRPYLDILNFEMGVFYDKYNDQKKALKYYNISLKKKSKDSYLVGSTYRNIGDMCFKNTEYIKAAKYYDSTLINLDAKTREYLRIKKIRTNLDDVVHFENVAMKNDSILKVVAMSDDDKVAYYETYILKLKKIAEEKRIAEEKEKQKQENIARNSATSGSSTSPGTPPKQPSAVPTTTSTSTSTSTKSTVASTFYFYNPSTVSFGKADFTKKWGNRDKDTNWRLSSSTIQTTQVATDSTAQDKKPEDLKLDNKEVPVEYTTAFYIDKLPKTQDKIDEIAKERNSAYYQLGIIYKEKFKEYGLASTKLEALLVQNPEEKLILPTLYNLYKIYEITKNDRADEMKKRITSQYPNSRYSQILNNDPTKNNPLIETPEEVYTKWYKLYEEEQFTLILEKIEELLVTYTGDDIISKFELLKANTIGKLRGLDAYKNALQYVADYYPNNEEGKSAQDVLANQIPLLEKMTFSYGESTNWKILYRIGKKEDKKTKVFEEKVKEIIESEHVRKLNYVFDLYTEKEDFLIIQGISSEGYANYITYLIDKKYKKLVPSPALVIMYENYKVIQIKKNIDDYLNRPKEAPIVKKAEPTPTPAATVIEKTPKAKPDPGVNEKTDSKPNSLPK